MIAISGINLVSDTFDICDAFSEPTICDSCGSIIGEVEYLLEREIFYRNKILELEDKIYRYEDVLVYIRGQR